MPQEAPTVRLAVREDSAAIMAMCHRLHEENGLFSFSEQKVQTVLDKCFDRQGNIVGVVGDGKIEGSICLALSDFYYTEDWYLAELWNFVDQDYRRSRNAEALIRFAKDCAEKMDCILFTGIITNRQMAGKVRLYRRLLGYPAGAFFIHNAKKWKSEPLEDHHELRDRLKAYADICNATPREVTFNVAQKKLGPLLREAAEAIGSEENLWGAPKSNGAHA